MPGSEEDNTMDLLLEIPDGHLEDIAVSEIQTDAGAFDPSTPMRGEKDTKDKNLPDRRESTLIDVDLLFAGSEVDIAPDKYEMAEDVLDIRFPAVTWMRLVLERPEHAFIQRDVSEIQ